MLNQPKNAVESPSRAFTAAVLFVTTIGFSLMSWAQNEQPSAPQSLSLAQAIEVGLKRSEDVLIAESELERADAQIREAWASAFPQVSASVGVNRYLEKPVIQIPGPDGTINEIPVKQNWEVQMGAQVTQVLWAFGRLGHGLELVRIGKAQREAGLEGAKRELRYQVVMAYYGVLIAEEMIEISQESLNNAQANRRSLQARFRGGRVPQYDNIKMSSDIASREPNLLDAKKRLSLAYLQLNLLLGLPPGSRPKLTTAMSTDFQIYSLDALVKQAEEKNVNLAVIEGEKKSAETMLKLTNSNRLPRLDGVLGASRVGTGPEINIDQDNYSNTVQAGVALTIPIWEGGAQGSRERQARVDVVQSEYRIQKYKESLRLQLESSLESYRADVEKFKFAERAQQLAQQTYLLTRTRFETGGATQKELNDVEMGLTGAKLQVKQTLMSIHQAQAQLQNLVDEVNQ